MKKILVQITVPQFREGRLFESSTITLPPEGDKNLLFFNHLRTRLQKKGYELLTADEQNLDGCEWVIFWDAFDIGPASYPCRWVF